MFSSRRKLTEPTPPEVRRVGGRAGSAILFTVSPQPFSLRTLRRLVTALRTGGAGSRDAAVAGQGAATNGAALRPTALPPPELRACFCHFCPQAFFKFNSHATSYSGEYFDPAAFSELSARERMILSPPDAREGAEEDGAQAARMGPKL